MNKLNVIMNQLIYIAVGDLIKTDIESDRRQSERRGTSLRQMNVKKDNRERDRRK